MVWRGEKERGDDRKKMERGEKRGESRDKRRELLSLQVDTEDFGKTL